jgi:hypothetical protein
LVAANTMVMVADLGRVLDDIKINSSTEDKGDPA